VVRVPISRATVAPDFTGGSIQHTAGDARRITLVRWKQPTLFAVPVAFGTSFPRTRGHTLDVLDPIAGFADKSSLLVDLCARETRYRCVRVNHVVAVMLMIEPRARSCFFELM
jgi:hypothetical protein